MFIVFKLNSKNKMLEKMSLFSETTSLLRSRCFLGITLGSTNRATLNHWKINLNSRNYLHSHHHQRIKRNYWSNLEKLDSPIHNDAFFKRLIVNMGFSFSRRPTMNTATANMNHIKIDRSLLLNRIRMYLQLKEEKTALLSTNSNFQVDIVLCNEVEQNNALKRNLYTRRQTPILLHQGTHTQPFYSRRSFSTLPTCDDPKPENNFSHVAPSSTDKLNVAPSSTDKLNVAPKNVLHNAYAVLAQELENKDFQLQPTYNIIKGKGNNHSWCCTYNVKWPETIKFVATASTKREASHKAATAALLWLKKNQRITADGHPIILMKNEVNEIARKSQPILNLNSNILNEMKVIADIYNKEFVPLLTKNLDQNKRDAPVVMEDTDLDINNNTERLSKKLFASSKYFAKEKISLPISAYKEQFINLLKENRALIIKGEPGCGKSTRIPQYVLESWAREGLDQGEFCQIAVTQPRRIAALSLADRVSDERAENCGHIVGYQIRLKSNYNPATGRILYCTTGILLKHLQTDVNLSKFSHVILDEAHERDVNTDLLMNLLRSALTTNPKLKLIVMSATVDANLFRRYLNDAPLMHIPGFTHPVESYFLDDLKEVDLSKSHKIASDSSEILSVVHEDVVKVINYLHRTKGEGAILCFLPGWEDITKVEKLIPRSGDISILCLHSRLQDSDQRKIFSRSPPGVRKVILSTNIAETSITIDDVAYVIDSGIHKENRFDVEKGVTCIDNYWISQSSMAQRRGRAGRVRPGESFHLYTKSKYESLPQFSDPEILKTSLTKIVLNSKVYSNNMDALEFMGQLPSPPDKNSTRSAVRELKELRLLNDNENLTSLGKTLANFQLEPKLSKVLVNALVFKCVTPVVDIVTMFSSDTELFSTALVNKDGIKRIKSQACKTSDHLAMMRLFEAWLQFMEDSGAGTAERYCQDANLVHYKLITVNKLRQIHFNYLHDQLHPALPIADNYSDNDELVKAVLFSGAGNLLRHQNWHIVKGRYKKGNVFLTDYNHKASITSESVNFKKTSFPSDFLVYFNEIRSNLRRTSLIRESSVIAPIAVLLFSDKDVVVTELEGEDKVTISLQDTKIGLHCSKEEALHIQKCKQALDAAYWYFIFQLTEGGEWNSEVNKVWDKILEHLNVILVKCSIK